MSVILLIIIVKLVCSVDPVLFALLAEGLEGG